MIRALVFLQVVGIVCMLAGFAITFTEGSSIVDQSKQQVIIQVEDEATPKVVLAEEAMKSPGIQGLLSDEQTAVINEEIATYLENPKDYIGNLVAAPSTKQNKENIAHKVKNPLARSLIEKVQVWKEQIRQHFKESFAALLLDLRIFTLSTATALAFSIYLIGLSSVHTKKILPPAIILTVATAISIYLYIEQNWLLNMLLNKHMGYTYPSGIFILFLWLLARYYETFGANDFDDVLNKNYRAKKA